ncbi:hypothetical protein NA57DRAFT_36507 [Rhizodiscina lignyota]|uniref:DUF7624 domain-containing protein n=1 Tax=Rhizodiscina lignyota TaxID=1504668 RepID=A0A9P4IJ83_9PEZI|nr:hypothetical protein NA57DRAFT_36507 [Rhizodiscina lignyota]
MPSPHLQSAFSPYSDSPSSPAPFPQQISDSSDKDSLVPPSPYPATVDPSPVDSQNSTSTDATDIELEEQEEQIQERHEDVTSPSNDEIVSPASAVSQEMPGKINTQLPPHLLRDANDGPDSVIHIPSGFKQFFRSRSTSSPSERSERLSERSESTVVSPNTPEKETLAERRAAGLHTSPINTSIPPDTAPNFGMTPRASTRQEAEEEYRRKARLSKSLEDIAEADDAEKPEEEGDFLEDDDGHDADESSMTSALESLNHAQEEISTLRNALSECWTLCNTLAGLSSNHRERMFSFTNTGDMQELAWKSCWRLCQNLYESRDEDHSAQIAQTLELCREFCQALFEARQRSDEAIDSVLRVSFELNNHLYNTHDRNLPLVFRERTLDFYVTMCHRLMKQRTSLPEETDSLLRACWSLAEMLFSLRQNNRDNKPPDEELLGSAVQACWELCDLFREGWSQVRPERGTPRPAPSRSSYHEPKVNSGASVAGSTISYAANQMLPPSRPTSSLSVHSSMPHMKAYPPETPTTLFDETADSPAVDPQQVPNIMVLGPDRHSPPQPRHWSSSASQSSYRSESSQRTSSTARNSAVYSETGEPYLPRLKALILKAAMNAGYNRASPQSLQNFVKNMPPNAFGTQQWQMFLLDHYRRLVLMDASFKPGSDLPSGRKTAAELARAVLWLSKNEQFGWLRELFRVVFGFLPEEAAGRGKMWIQT